MYWVLSTSPLCSPPLDWLRYSTALCASCTHSIVPSWAAIHNTELGRMEDVGGNGRAVWWRGALTRPPDFHIFYFGSWPLPWQGFLVDIVRAVTNLISLLQDMLIGLEDTPFQNYQETDMDSTSKKKLAWSAELETLDWEQYLVGSQ